MAGARRGVRRRGSCARSASRTSSAADIDNILAGCTVAPMVNQVLAHISNTPTQLIAYSQQHGMLVEAYSPMAHGELFKNRQVADMAERYGVSLAQLSIRYTLQLGLLPLAQDREPGSHADQRRRGLRDRRRGHGTS